MRNKKELTPEQKVRRAKYALGFIGFMLIFILLARFMDGTNENQDRDRIDILLDSILVSDFPEGTQIASTSYIETVTERTPEMDSLHAMRVRYRKTMNRNIIEKKLDTTETGRIRRDIRELEKIIRKQEADGLPEYYMRAVKFRLPDSVIMFAYQKTDIDKRRSGLIDLCVLPGNGENVAKSVADEIANDIYNGYADELEEINNYLK